MVSLNEAKFFKNNVCRHCEQYSTCKKNLDHVRKCADHVHEENIGFTFEELLNNGVFDDDYFFGVE